MLTQEQIDNLKIDDTLYQVDITTDEPTAEKVQYNGASGSGGCIWIQDSRGEQVGVHASEPFSGFFMTKQDCISWMIENLEDRRKRVYKEIDTINRQIHNLKYES